MKKLDRLINTDFITDGLDINISKHNVTEDYDLHWHEFYEIEYILSGRGIYSINGIEYEIKSGDIFLMTPVDFHEIKVDKEESINLINIMFSERIIDENMIMHLYNISTNKVTRCGDEENLIFNNLFNNILYEFNNNKKHSLIYIKNILSCILICIIRETNNLTTAKSIDQFENRIQLALHYIQNHFREALTLKIVSDYIGMSQNYFSEKFHAFTNKTFKEYLIDLRLDYVKKLLTISDLPITEICYASGFNNLSHFLRVFKGKYKITPKTYRKNEARYRLNSLLNF